MQMSDIAGFLNLQSSRPLTIKTWLSGTVAWEFGDFQCAEGLSTPFDVRRGPVPRDSNITVKPLIGPPATVSPQASSGRSGGSARHCHGCAAPFTHEDAEGGPRGFDSSGRGDEPTCFRFDAPATSAARRR